MAEIRDKEVVWLDETLVEKQSGVQYVVVDIIPGYWGDGATGYFLIRKRGTTKECSFPLRIEEVRTIYRR